ncbi:1-phosphofructokinase family hexose kinase [Arthrobacter woluwensis]|uniref:1-phosphofructokinase n=1 Tax=Arthrobacter woluwensis TaxID=156980 RepID=A0A1H4KIV9_9MICC|nr:1-phosphofructokinase family hexose kinase [Arthrobacter woluwensis]SEB58484.1 1-phosphofructokinase [Arthrobacter woluwensis]
MILTVTPNPAIDWTVTTDSFAFDAVNVATESTREASGKGINVSVALRRNGVPTQALFPAGGGTGVFMREQLAGMGVDAVVVPSGAEVRTNITLRVPGHAGTKINEPGAPLGEDLAQRLIDAVRVALSEALTASDGVTTLALCGSLPPGAPEGFHPALVRLGRELGAAVVVDASGEVLSRALAAGPGLVKPNVHELAAETGRELGTVGDVVDAAREVLTRGAGAVLASLGADGMVYVDAGHALHGWARDVRVLNTVGAGDASLAGFLAARDGGAEPAGCLASAILYASSAVGHATTLFDLDPELRDRITVTDAPDAARPLSEPAKG